ncbi:hypothetical protein F5883DRAFT_194354 [Diaporthe sp. PMI_573]|nr:hypothetical protein F5883DRAFT_194354 [Diaporthaceae sp. PMI_573]
MSDQDGGRGHPAREAQESAYPPPPGEEDDRSRASYHHLPPPPQATVTLPPIHDAHPAYGASRYPPPPDPRTRGTYSASPTGGPNGYPAPPGGLYNLPPVQAPQDQRHYGVEPRDYYSRGGSFPPHPQPEPYNYGGYRPPSGPPYGAYPPEYARGPGGAAQQAAPRQRTSIACRYCRKRKIRCSGYSQTPDGKCTNCRKTGNECIFQPVSSSSTTAFVPVSAVPGGVPPGTPLFGAFGQPLPQGGGQPGQHGGAPQPPAGGSQQPYPPSENYALPSPTGSYYPPPPEDRSGVPQRRLHEEEHGQRLPPPHVYGEPDPRRRSPASSAPGGTPPQYEYPPPDRTSTPSQRRESPNASQSGQQGGSVMALSSLMEHPPPRPPPSADSSRDIDQNMLGRLNRRT